MTLDLDNMELSELLDLLSIRTSQLLKAIDRRHRDKNAKELKKEVEVIQTLIRAKKQ